MRYSCDALPIIIMIIIIVIVIIIIVIIIVIIARNLQSDRFYFATVSLISLIA